MAVETPLSTLIEILIAELHRAHESPKVLTDLVKQYPNSITLLTLGPLTNVAAAIERMPERERLLLSLYYEEELNLREIGAVLEVTQSRVCQLHSQAISRLRSTLRESFESLPSPR